jgi:NADH-quinone oxidoreductase subunit F
MGTEKSKGYTLYSLSGHVKNPGQYEAPLGITLRQLLELSGGMREGHRLKFWTPGGSSTPLLTEEHLDVPLDYEGVAAAGSMLGTKALQCFDETTCVVRAVLRWTEFYAHESCGKCTPCREGTYWMVQVLERLEAGTGTEEDIATLLDTCDNIFRPLVLRARRRATSPIVSGGPLFREEFLAHITQRGCPFDPVASTVFAGAHA